jgi:hypothetical protein
MSVLLISGEYAVQYTRSPRKLDDTTAIEVAVKKGVGNGDSDGAKLMIWVCVIFVGRELFGLCSGGGF